MYLFQSIESTSADAGPEGVVAAGLVPNGAVGGGTPPRLIGGMVNAGAATGDVNEAGEFKKRGERRSNILIEPSAEHEARMSGW